MVCIAAGGTWPRQGIKDEVGGIDSTTSAKCGVEGVTPLHRMWLWRCKVESRAHQQSDNLVAEALPQ
eukprot:7166351-Pyramimonas_sp.AAC.1